MKSQLLALVCVPVLVGTFAFSDDRPKDAKKDAATAADARRAAQRGLEPFNDWVGTWRGVGQPKRGSSKGAWTEEADWAWKLDRESAGLQIEIKDGKQLQSGVLSFDPGEKKFRFGATLPGGDTRTYVGERGDEGRVILVNTDESTKDQHRLTFQMRHEDRMLLLIETKAASQPSFSRVAEVGYTRKGGSFASAADAGPKCIVTGGRGSMTVEYKGKTYYVCCSGCRAAFQEDPEGIIAEAAERTKKEASEKKKK
jgi:YHS domain-containing protein